MRSDVIISHSQRFTQHACAVGLRSDPPSLSTREVDETTDVSTRIDESFAKLKNYLNKYGNSVERTTMQSPTMVTRPPTGISTPPRQPNQVVIESPSSQRSTRNTSRG